MLIGEILRRQASPSGRPNRAALITERGPVTYAALHEASRGVARALASRGLVPETVLRSWAGTRRNGLRSTTARRSAGPSWSR